MTRRLLIIVNVDWFFLSHRLPVALAARDAGFEVHVATTLTASAQMIERHGFTVHPLSFERKSASLIDGIKLLLLLRSLMRNLAPEVVHLVTIKPVLIGGIAARLMRIPRVLAAVSGLGYVFTERGIKAAIRRFLVTKLYRIALGRKGVKVVFQNSEDQLLLQKYARVREAQVVLIPGSGVDLSEWTVQPLPQGPALVMMVSRLLVHKGVHEYVEAARRLHGYKSARFVLIGDIDPQNPTSLSREQIQAWVREGIIEWWGHRADMPSILSFAHIVVLPSYREGLPKVLIEAAASARAIVTTNVPGCRDAILPDVTGILVEPRNPLALTEGIKTLLDDPHRVKSMGEAGRRLAEEIFDVRDVIACHLAAYLDNEIPTYPIHAISAATKLES